MRAQKNARQQLVVSTKKLIAILPVITRIKCCFFVVYTENIYIQINAYIGGSQTLLLEYKSIWNDNARPFILNWMLEFGFIYNLIGPYFRVRCGYVIHYNVCTSHILPHLVKPLFHLWNRIRNPSPFHIKSQRIFPYACLAPAYLSGQKRNMTKATLRTHIKCKPGHHYIFNCRHMKTVT